MNATARTGGSATQADAYYCEMPSDPCAIVMFGASGDLARRKLLPALFDLAWHACLAPSFRLVGFARTPMSDEDFRIAFKGSRMKRAKLQGLKRNAAVVLENVGTTC